MALLLYSNRCTVCQDILKWLDKHKQVAHIVRYHDVSVKGIPQQYRSKIKVVPTLLTQNGKMLTGSEVKAWLVSMAPAPEISNFCFSGKCAVYGINDDDDDGDIFSLDSYGQSIQPALTPELSERINSTVMDRYQKFQSDNTLKD